MEALGAKSSILLITDSRGIYGKDWFKGEDSTILVG